MSAGQGGRAIDTHAAFTDYLTRRVPTANTSEMQTLTVSLYRWLGRGAPVVREQLGTACAISPDRTDQFLSELLPTTLVLDEGGAIIAFGGLSLIPTHHRFVTREADLYTWCVLDALFLPEVLDKSATLVTHCPSSGAELTVELTPGEVRVARPSGCVMSIVTPDSRACCDNLRKAFCDHVNLFRDEETFGAWSQGRQNVGYVTLQEAQVFARQRNALRYPDINLTA
jgi:alkylmercury lyase